MERTISTTQIVEASSHFSKVKHGVLTDQKAQSFARCYRILCIHTDDIFCCTEDLRQGLHTALYEDCEATFCFFGLTSNGLPNNNRLSIIF